MFPTPYLYRKQLIGGGAKLKHILYNVLYDDINGKTAIFSLNRPLCESSTINMQTWPLL